MAESTAEDPLRMVVKKDRNMQGFYTYKHVSNILLVLNVEVSVGPLLPFEGVLSVLMSPGQVTGPSQGKSSGGAATLMPLDLHAFLQRCAPLAEWAQF